MPTPIIDKLIESLRTANGSLLSINSIIELGYRSATGGKESQVKAYEPAYKKAQENFVSVLNPFFEYGKFEPLKYELEDLFIEDKEKYKASTLRLQKHIEESFSRISDKLKTETKDKIIEQFDPTDQEERNRVLQLLNYAQTYKSSTDEEIENKVIAIHETMRKANDNAVKDIPRETKRAFITAKQGLIDEIKKSNYTLVSPKDFQRVYGFILYDLRNNVNRAIALSNLNEEKAVRCDDKNSDFPNIEAEKNKKFTVVRFNGARQKLLALKELGILDFIIENFSTRGKGALNDSQLSGLIASIVGGDLSEAEAISKDLLPIANNSKTSKGEYPINESSISKLKKLFIEFEIEVRNLKPQKTDKKSK